MHGIHPPGQSSSIVQSYNTSLYTHEQYCADLLLRSCCTYCHLLDIVFISCSHIRHVIILFSLSFLCILAQSHLRSWVCMPRYFTLRGPGVLRRIGWAAVGPFVTVLLLLAISVLHIVLFLCSSYVVVLYIFINMLTDSYVLYFWVLWLYYVLLLHVIYILDKQCPFFIFVLVQFYRRLSVYTHDLSSCVCTSPIVTRTIFQ